MAVTEFELAPANDPMPRAFLSEVSYYPPPAPEGARTCRECGCWEYEPCHQPDRGA